MTRYKLLGLVTAVLMTIATLYAVSATSTATTTTAATADLAGPINAAFYYPWYPETEHWSTHYNPTLGKYDSRDPAVLAQHVTMAKYAGLDAFISSWWGAGTQTADRLPALLDAAAAQKFSTAAYYEKEGTADPTVAEIQTDLAAIPKDHSAYLHVGGKPVLFVYNADDTSCAVVDKWKQAAPDWYLSMKVFPGYTTCANQPDSWHQYGPATGYDKQGSYSASVSPGFFKFDEATPRLARDLTRFRTDVTSMRNADVKWKLLTTFNEWGEGTSIEPAQEWASTSGNGDYLDALHDVLAPTVTPPVTPSPAVAATPSPAVAVTATPVADSYVAADAPTRNFGTKATLKVDGSPADRDFFRFDVAGLNGQPVAQATLRLYVGTAGSGPINVQLVSDNTWTETGVTYSNQPAVSGTAVSKSTTGAGYVDFDVTGKVTREGLVSFRADTTAVRNRAIGSRESANKPRLVVCTAADCSTSPVQPATNQSPTASFTASASGLTATVNGSASADPDGTVAGYAWNWGDGTPGGTGATATHTYASAGTYSVGLTVTDNGGVTGSTSQTVTISATPPVNKSPVASFTATSGDLTAAVDASASSDPDGTVAGYAWNWGDGTADGSGKTATHAYAAAGTYPVTLTVTDNGGLTGSASRSVTVSPSPPPPPTSSVTKVLVFVEENHSLDEMRAQMPYTASLAQQYGYATNYKAITHPSLPNYLAMAGGTTAGVTDDNAPASHPIASSSVFGQAIAAGRTAKTYAEGMTSNCMLTNTGRYVVKHNPWAYYTPTSERPQCQQFDVPETALKADITAGTLPNVGLVIPDLCNDAHDCGLATADNWFKTRMQAILAGPDWQSGHLAVILTADEDDSSQSNTVLTMVVHPSQSGHVVSTPLNHYSLTRLLADVGHASSYVNNAATAADMASAFGLTIG